MFPRDQRLRRRRDIARVLKQGRRLSNNLLMIRLLPSNIAGPRVTVVVGLAVHKRATVRNRLKRQVRHLLRQELKERDVLGRGVDLMVSPRVSMLREPKDIRARALRELLDRIYPSPKR